MEEVIITRVEFENWMRVINKKLDMLSANKPRFITRKEIIAENGYRFYEKVRASIEPLKKGGRSASVRFERREYERFLEEYNQKNHKNYRRAN
jgi:hypothetical protein